MHSGNWTVLAQVAPPTRRMDRLGPPQFASRLARYIRRACHPQRCRVPVPEDGATIYRPVLLVAGCRCELSRSRECIHSQAIPRIPGPPRTIVRNDRFRLAACLHETRLQAGLPALPRQGWSAARSTLGVGESTSGFAPKQGFFLQESDVDQE